MAILERLEDPDDDLSRHPVQFFSAADLAHLASHLAESTRTLSDQARRMEAFPDEAVWALGLIKHMFLPCILKPLPLQGTDNSLYRLWLWEKASRQRGVCVDHLHRCKTSFCLFCAFVVVPTRFSCHICRGMECASDVSIQRRRICCTVIWIGDAQSTYLLNLFQKWEEAQPKNLHVVYLTCQFFLHCCRNMELLSIKFVWFCYTRTFLRART